MMHRRTLLGAGLAAPMLTGCGVGADSWTLRYRLKVRVFADGQSHEGASVFKSIYTRNPEPMLNRPSEFRTRAWGEAIVVGVGARGTLFGLLSSVAGVEGPYFDPGHEQSIVELLPGNQYTPANILSGRVYEMMGRLRGEIDVPPRRWPVLVRFADTSDLSSVRLVEPAGLQYRLSPGTPAQSLIEMTNASVTRRIDRLLPWVGELPGARPGLTILGAPRDPLRERLEYRHFLMKGYTR
jgi:hypothetical protein